MCNTQSRQRRTHDEQAAIENKLPIYLYAHLFVAALESPNIKLLGDLHSACLIADLDEYLTVAIAVDQRNGALPQDSLENLIVDIIVSPSCPKPWHIPPIIKWRESQHAPSV